MLEDAAGDLDGYRLSKTDKVSEEEFEELLADARRRAGAIVARMRSGQIDRDPGPRPGLRDHGVCPPFCDFAPICRRDRAPVEPLDRRSGRGAMSKRRPTEEQRAAIEATAAEVLVEAGAGTGKTGVMVDRYCRLVCEQGVSPGAVLAFTFTDKAAAELRQRIRAEIERRAEAGSARARELLPTLGSAWVTTIHGFCNRLLSAHPVAVGIDPRFRVLDAPETERAAVETFDDALEAFLAGGDREREDTVAAFDIGGLRGIVLGVHAELRSRGEAEPRLPEPPEPDVAGALRQAAAVAAETIGELKPGSANHELVERALDQLESTEGSPNLDQMASLRTTSKAKPLGAYKEAIDAALSRVAEAGEGGRAYRHVAELLRFVLRALRPRQAKARRHRLRGPAAAGGAAARSEPRRARPTGSASATSSSTSSRTPTASS